MSQQNHKREGATAYRVVMNKAVFAIFVRDNIVWMLLLMLIGLLGNHLRP